MSISVFYKPAVIIGQGSSATLISQSFTSNGTYDASNFSADGFNQVTVSVAGGDVDQTAVKLLTDDLQRYTLPSIIGSEYHELRNGAFAFCRDIKELDFNNEQEVPMSCCLQAEGLISVYGSQVKMIRDSAFYSCRNLTTVSFPNCELIVGYLNFSACFSLSSFYMPNLKILGVSEFGSGHSGGWTFVGAGLRSASFPKLEYIIGGTHFSGCFYSVDTLELPELVAISGAEVFQGCYFSHISIPNCCSIGWQSAFKGCANLQEIIIPFANFGSVQFYNCGNLSYCDARYVLSGHNSVFYNCKKLEEVVGVINATWTQMFDNCEKLKSICLKGGSISTYFLRSCKSLASVYILRAYNNMTLPNLNAFSSTPIVDSSYLGYFGSIYVPSSLVDTYKASTNWATISDRITALPAEFSSKYVYESEFYNQSITQIPSEKLDAETVLTGAFNNCKSLSTISLSKCKAIDAWGFSECWLVSEMSLPELEYLGNGAFTRVVATNGFIELPKLKKMGSSNFYVTNTNGFPINSYPSFSANFPELIYIESGCFLNVLMNAISASKLKFIGNSCFQNLSLLTRVSFPECLDLLSSCFIGCSQLSEMYFPKLIFNHCNINCSALQVLSMPNVLATAGFSNCYSLTELNFPKLLFFMSYTVISNCSKLSRIYAPLAENYPSYISNCKALTELRVIKPSVFGTVENCQSISKILLENADTIGSGNNGHAIYSCKKMEKLYLMHHHIVDVRFSQTYSVGVAFKSTPFIESSHLGYYGSIYVPLDLLSEYQNHVWWGAISDRFVGLTDEEFQDVIDHWDD